MANTLIDVSLDHTWSEPQFAEAHYRPRENQKIYDKETIDQLELFANPENIKVKKFFEPFVKEGTSPYFDNLNARIDLLHINDQIIPLLVPEIASKNSYVCSPSGHYVQLPIESLFLLKNRLAKSAAKVFFKCFGWALKKCNIDNVIYVNHWLFSTDLYPDGLSDEHIGEITELLVEKYPNHAIAFRSVNEETTPHLPKIFDERGYNAIASRQVYISSPADPAVHKTRIIKSDLKLLRESTYEVVEGKALTDAEVDMVLNLHIKLTITHHSKLNPKMTKKLMCKMIADDMLNIYALRKDGIIDGVIGYIEKDNVLTCPLFGFDLAHPDKTKIYRLLSTLLFTEAQRKNKVFHQSAGASFYKTLRRSKPQIEYLYVYTKHLTKRQVLGWKSLQAVINTLGKPFMRKY